MGPDAEAATRYRQRAEELRVIARDFTDRHARRVLQDIATDYEHMAQSRDSMEIMERRRSPKP